MSVTSIGDDIMAAAEAEWLHLDTGKRVRIVDEHGALRWHSLWERNPAIVSPADNKLYPYAELRNHRGNRAYVLEHHRDRFVFNPAYRAHPATIYLSEPERAFAQIHAGHVIIEPNVPVRKPNKQWGIERWRRLIDLMHGAGMHPAQLGPRSTTVLTGCRHIVTETIREAASVLSTARAAVLPEGGLHHLAAAVRLPAVVLFGGFIHPRTTGYSMHRNIFTGRDGPCGNRRPCEHCAKAMAAIEPESVFAELRTMLMQRRAA